MSRADDDARFLVLEDVRTHFPVTKGLLRRRVTGHVKAVDGVDLTLRRGEILGLVGESGCGKSTLSRTIMQLIPATTGRISLEGRDLCCLTPDEVRAARIEFQMVFQDPYASLNPRLTVYDTLAEAIATRHPGLPRAAMQERVAALLARVGLSPRQMRKYPHEFSGGQRQRIAIARALAPEPRLILADEPVSALDVSIQSQILNLLQSLVRDLGLTMVFISHDLGVVRYLADRIAVMYLGRIVEVGPAEAVMDRPLHPYTRALVSAIPVPDPVRERKRRRLLLQGDPPSPLNPPAGCAFHPRCPWATDACRGPEAPVLEARPDGRTVSCFRVDELPKE